MSAFCFLNKLIEYMLLYQHTIKLQPFKHCSGSKPHASLGKPSFFRSCFQRGSQQFLKEFLWYLFFFFLGVGRGARSSLLIKCSTVHIYATEKGFTLQAVPNKLTIKRSQVSVETNDFSFMHFRQNNAVFIVYNPTKLRN